MREIGVVGLGRMGSGIAKRLKTKGWRVAGYDVSEESRRQARDAGIETHSTPEELCQWFSDRKLLWIMVPAQVVDSALQSLAPFLEEGDTLIEGGNSYFRDSIRRYRELAERGIRFLDVGVSGGVWGEREGYCLMIGGDREVFEEVEDLFRDLAYEGDGYGYVGAPGSGHFVKMVHNGIEYGMMQAIAEGFELMKESEFDLDLEEVARIYTRGSVIRSWLMDLTYKAFKDFKGLEGIEPYVEDSGEGRWTILEAVHSGVPVWVMADALWGRFRSRQRDSFRDKLLAALRFEFGGHTVKRKEE